LLCLRSHQDDGAQGLFFGDMSAHLTGVIGPHNPR
jgi:hypothetical protein